MRSLVFFSLALSCCGACSGEQPRAAENRPLVVFAAASLVRPLTAALDSFTGATGIRSRLVIGGSLDLARRVTDLRETPDMIVLADEEILRRILLGGHAGSYARFAVNRLVIAYADTAASMHALDSLSWADALVRGREEGARADPARAPVGYRTLLAWKLAERRLGRPGLARALEARAPRRNMRGNEAELIALVRSGTVDYAWVYESSARAAGLPVLRLPSWMDFGDPAQRDWYASETVRVDGLRPRAALAVTGEPITYVLAVLDAAGQRAGAERLAAYLVGDSGARVLRANGLQVMQAPVIVCAPGRT